MMRSNPKFNSLCWNQIGAYRKDPCYDCVKLSECDQHYDPKTGEWDYTHPLALRQPKPRLVPHTLRKKRSAIGSRSKSKIEEGHRTYLVLIGKASRIPIRTNLTEALIKAGLVPI